MYRTICLMCKTFIYRTKKKYRRLFCLKIISCIKKLTMYITITSLLFTHVNIH